MGMEVSKTGVIDRVVSLIVPAAQAQTPTDIVITDDFRPNPPASDPCNHTSIKDNLNTPAGKRQVVRDVLMRYFFPDVMYQVDAVDPTKGTHKIIKNSANLKFTVKITDKQKLELFANDARLDELAKLLLAYNDTNVEADKRQFYSDAVIFDKSYPSQVNDVDYGSYLYTCGDREQDKWSLHKNPNADKVGYFHAGSLLGPTILNKTVGSLPALVIPVTRLKDKIEEMFKEPAKPVKPTTPPPATVTAPALDISSLTPAVFTAGGKKMTVTVKGSGFSKNAEVTSDDCSAALSESKVVSDSVIKFNFNPGKFSDDTTCQITVAVDKAKASDTVQVKKRRMTPPPPPPPTPTGKTAAECEKELPGSKPKGDKCECPADKPYNKFKKACVAKADGGKL